ncbi:SAM-dependent methyltransferase [Litoribacter alkaliphilus]|uniref:SAM-dependent methyltransferase n=1 Tax=Litoribacter ruber TaxID=702568 RepID=A0AAP2CIK0_9BACT|nr:SAM-dependent methyltransferase [Litoribacter alkaliphilus]MBS9524324.1 SAM-dependent methyltransferase [Litoribacter alkaliphilus]
MVKKKGTLYLIPSVLAEDTAGKVITPQVKELLPHIQHYAVENLRTARRYISSLRLGITIEDLQMDILDKKTKPHQLDQLLKPLMEGHDMGVVSEAGCPGIADPGAIAVDFAHRKGIRVVPLTGPSSMFLALMASGFSGQSFAFHGYLPIDKKAKIEAIKNLEQEALKLRRTQIFMETPFRNNALLDDLKTTLHPNTRLCIAKNITGSDEMIVTKTIAEWKKSKIELHKIPTVFLIGESQG